MRRGHLPGRMALVCVALGFVSEPAWSQQPAPVQDVSTLPHRTPEDERGDFMSRPASRFSSWPPSLRSRSRSTWPSTTVAGSGSRIPSSIPIPPRTEPKPRHVKILSDFGPDGKAHSIWTFADGLNIPIGLLPLPSQPRRWCTAFPISSCCAIPMATAAPMREVLYGVFGHRDTHGMTNAFTWGFDGWVYACHGYSNDSTVEGKDKRPISMSSGNTYRMKADGSHAEYVTHGQVNPFGLAFDELGNLYSCDCHSRPVYQLLRGAWYPSFGKPHDGLGFGPEMVNYDHGSTGIAGISYYAADQFPEAYRGTIFIGNVVTNRINHDRIEWHGSTPKGIEQPDFVWSEDNWFRPVDIELGPDGALYVADFYNRIIGHYEVPLTHPGRDRTSGRIWRIVYRGPDGKLPPPPGRVDRTKSTIDALLADLTDPNLAVRISASNQLVERGGKDAVPRLIASLKLSAGQLSMVHALWVLHRLGALDDETLLSWAREAAFRNQRVHVLKVLCERPALSEALHKLALAGLTDKDAFARRAAAEALGAHPDLANIQPLLALRQSTTEDDTHLIHVVRMALRDQLKTAEVWPMLETLGLNERDRRDLADVATGVASPAAAAFLLDHLRTFTETQENLLRYVHHIARHGVKGSAAQLVAVVQSHDRSPSDRLALFRMIQQGTQERGDALDSEVRKLAGGLCRELLASRDAVRVGLGIEAARDFQFAELIPALKEVAGREDLPEARRGEALPAIAAVDPAKALVLLRELLVDSQAALGLRESAAITLANLERPEAQATVLAALPTATERLQSTIAAALARRREGAEALLNAIEAGKGSARLLQERRVVIGLENAEIPHLSERIAGLLKGLPPADQKLSEMMGERRTAFLRGSCRCGPRRTGVREELRQLPPARRQGRKGRSPA